MGGCSLGNGSCGERHGVSCPTSQPGAWQWDSPRNWHLCGDKGELRGVLGVSPWVCLAQRARGRAGMGWNGGQGHGQGGKGLEGQAMPLGAPEALTLGSFSLFKNDLAMYVC